MLGIVDLIVWGVIAYWAYSKYCMFRAWWWLNSVDRHILVVRSNTLAGDKCMIMQTVTEGLDTVYLEVPESIVYELSPKARRWVAYFVIKKYGIHPEPSVKEVKLR